MIQGLLRMVSKLEAAPLGDPKTRNGGMTERRNGGKLPQILKRGMAENHP